MPKNIVVCCDGTGNQIGRNISNVFKLFRICVKDDRQRVYYNSGIGTIGSSDEWTRHKQDIRAAFALATGYGLDNDILGAYGHICRHFQSGDEIFLFGFSRGAYVVRAVAGMIHMLGLLPEDQLNIASYGLRAYKQASNNQLKMASEFGKMAGGRRVPIKFIGVWDTVSSVIVPRGDRIVPQLLTLPYTRTNPSVEIFRHAIAIDERRRMFRLNRWLQPQKYAPNPFAKQTPLQEQDVRQVWFAGVHSDVGGGYPEVDSALSKYPLNWMIDQAVAKGLKVNNALRNYLAHGKSRMGGPDIFVAADFAAMQHDSLNAAWWPFEWIPKSAKLREWPARRSLLGWYLPQAEPRRIDTDDLRPLIHESVIDRKQIPGVYDPINLPTDYDIEPY